MTLYIWLSLGLVLAVQGREYNLKWPTKYTTKATKIVLTSNLIEEYQIWKTRTKTRIDYNDGAVTSIEKHGKKYQMQPEAFLNQTVYTACYYSYASLDDILPDTEDLEFTVKEDIGGKHTLKYEYDFTDDDDNVRTKRTLWAAFNALKKYWSPVRYESLIYNTELGYKKSHEIWEFSAFSTRFSSKGVFDVNFIDDCEEAPEEVTMDSDAVTKDLVFIDPEKEEHVDHVFNKFKHSYGKQYADEKEHDLRRRIFQNNMRLIAATNNKNLGYKLAVNKFADRSPQEINKYKGLRRRSVGKSGNVPFPYTQSKLTELSNDLPSEYDLRLYGVVSEVKNQEDCGSCWTFGTTAAVEGALARVNGGRLMALANQALLDCAWAYGGSGCSGGTDNGAYEWMIEYGLPTVAEYGPYKNKDGICNIKNMTKLYPIRGYTDVTPRSVEALKIAVINHGPLTVSVHTSPSFQSYSSGIFYDTNCTETNLDHEVSLVGYGERYGETFWILKNSWGPHWGIDGYMYISSLDNVCGVATEPTYVVF